MNEFEQLRERVQKAAADLGEFADAVQIFVNIQRGDSHTTVSYDFGVGNWYARKGQINEWLTMQDTYSKQEAVRRAQENAGD